MSEAKPIDVCRDFNGRFFGMMIQEHHGNHRQFDLMRKRNGDLTAWTRLPGDPKVLPYNVLTKIYERDHDMLYVERFSNLTEMEPGWLFNENVDLIQVYNTSTPNHMFLIRRSELYDALANEETADEEIVRLAGKPSRGEHEGSCGWFLLWGPIVKKSWLMRFGRNEHGKWARLK